MVEQLHLEIISGDALSTSEHQTVVSLCSRAFEEDMAPLMATFGGETHVLGTYEGVFVTPPLLPHRRPQGVVDLLQRPVIAPDTEVVIDTLPFWIVFRQHPPLDAPHNNIHDGIDDLTHIQAARSAA